MDVEPGEAELNLDALDDLFDYYYVKLPKVSAVRASLDARQAAPPEAPRRSGLPTSYPVSPERKARHKEIIERVISGAEQSREPDDAPPKEK